LRIDLPIGSQWFSAWLSMVFRLAGLKVLRPPAESIHTKNVKDEHDGSDDRGTGHAKRWHYLDKVSTKSQATRTYKTFWCGSFQSTTHFCIGFEGIIYLLYYCDSAANLFAKFLGVDSKESRFILSLLA
jgi:hypothetical protein